jgi:hypothetical protein
MSDNEIIEYKGYGIEIVHDDTELNPREDFDPLGTMICFHRRYNLGDKHNWKTPDEAMRGLAIAADETVQDRIEFWEDGKRWRKLANLENKQKFELGKKVFTAPDAANEKIKELIQSTLKKHYVILPLYLYDHSGITISTGPFSCPWDSGQVGFIYITKKKACQEYGRKRLGRANRKKLISYLKQEVETYDQFLTGDVHGYHVHRLNSEGEIEDDDDILDSCYGYFGSNWEDNGLFESAKGAIDYEIRKEQEMEDFYRNSFAL